MIILKIAYEAARQAVDSLKGSKLRTFLSLLGITIGIFCIIAVKSAVDSLQDNIMSGFNELGSDVIYIDKSPWSNDAEINYWKYNKRPDPSFEDFKTINTKSKLSEAASFTIFTGGKMLKFKNSSLSNIVVMGPTFDYPKVSTLEIEQGRYFTKQEYDSGANKLILGGKLAKELFTVEDPIGQSVKFFGQEFIVIGILKEEGENPFNFLKYDELAIVSYPTISKFVNTKDNSRVGKLLNVKALPGTDLTQLKGELTGILRAERRLRPSEEDNFSLNELSMLSNALDQVFGVLNISGLFIGIFALIVGMFSVANIMFVSVKERTSIIGVKKALGAKRNIILLEFLIEAVILCIIGGIMGLMMVFGILKGLSSVIPFEISLSLPNLILGVAVSIVVGIISGIIPAMQASKLDPVEAIRS